LKREKTTLDVFQVFIITKMLIFFLQEYGKT
jgi:hypothetical protein